MSYYVVHPPRRSHLTRVLVLVGVVASVALALLGGWAAAQPIGIRVDGRECFLPPRTTVGDLRGANVLAAKPGKLIGVDGAVLRSEGGSAATVIRNGRVANAAQRLFPGDTIVSVAGADRRESLVVTDVPVPFKTRYEGTGSITEMKTLGSPGIRRVTQGEVSGIEVTSTIVSQPSDLVIARTRPTGKVVAITFDDGPWPSQTDRILKVLEKEDVHATFFMLGSRVKRDPATARRVAEAGHTVGSHTYSHKPLSTLSAAQVRREIRRGRDALRQATGEDSAWLRPPYGAMDSDAWREVRRLKARAVLWDVDSRDWTRPGSVKIERTVIANVRPGSVVLFHDGGGNRNHTIAALPRIIRRLKAKGYTFVTVEELAEMRAEKAKKASAGARDAKGKAGSS